MNKEELKQLKRQLPKLPGEKTYTYHYACMECGFEWDSNRNYTITSGCKKCGNGDLYYEKIGDGKND